MSNQIKPARRELVDRIRDRDLADMIIGEYRKADYLLEGSDILAIIKFPSAFLYGYSEEETTEKFIRLIQSFYECE